jgi:hypothetical protein
VVEINRAREDLMISLAGYRGETMDSVKRRTLGDILILTAQYNKENGRH